MKKELHYYIIPRSINKYFGDIRHWNKKDFFSENDYVNGLFILFEKCFRSYDKFLQVIDHTESVIFYLDKNNNVVGSLMLTGASTEKTIHHVMVDPDYQKQGIATKMLEYVIDYSFHNISLLLLKSNPPLRKFYEKIGFKVFTETE